MKKLTENEIDFLIEMLKNGKELPLDYKYQLFPTKQKEYELAYAGKMRKEDLLANEDGVFPVPLQVEKFFNDDEYETFDDDWKNMIVFGDNLQFLKTIYENQDPLIQDKIKGKIKLIYIDPPFATTDEFQNKEGAKAYNDKRKGAEFVEFLRRRLILAKEILADDGGIYVHLDSKMSHYIKVLMDEIFGKNNFRNEVIWRYKSSVAPKKDFQRNHGIIYRYSKTDNYFYNIQYDSYADSTIKRFDKIDKSGKKYKIVTKGTEKFKVYMKSLGNPADDVWYYQIIVGGSNENLDYPTQKPEALLKRIIKASSNEGDIVLDFFGGSGTTMAVAEKLGRKWITCDLGKLAYFTMQKRILQIQDSKDLENPSKKYGKQAKNFVTAQLGMYDLKKALALEWKKYQQFVSGLFEVEIKKNNIAGYEFDGKKGDYPVKIFNYQTFKDSAINEDYLKEIHNVIGKKASGRVYIIAPANFVDFLTDYHEIDHVKYYFLKIPYHVIKELHKTPFQKLRQPQSKKNVNDIDEAIGFHFIRQPEIKSKITKHKDKVTIHIESFVSREFESNKSQDEKGMKNFETLSAVFVDKNYDGKAFEMDEAKFADELQQENHEINFNKSELGKQIMIVYTDIYGNDFTEIFTI